jgi:uncharacterized membrane protein YbhN (UPF0104 family)
LSNRLRLALRWALTVALLAVLFWQLDIKAVAGTLSAISLWMLLPIGGLVVLQVVVSAWRWRYTASALGLAISPGLAFREYYLATCLNQILPGGVVGDINRAWRQGLRSGEKVTALHSVMIERLSGQLLLGLAAFMGAVLYFPQTLRLSGADSAAWLISLAVVLVVAAGLLQGRVRRYLAALRKDLRRSLLGWPQLPVQIFSSALVLGGYLGVFLVLGAGQGNWAGTGSVGLLLALSMILLLAMVVPLTVAGWGVREGAAAILWPLVGLPAEQGVALSVGYGVVNLLWSVPGGLLVFTGPGETPDQTTYRSPG